MNLTEIKNKDLCAISPKNDGYITNKTNKFNIILFITLEGTLGQIIQINKDILFTPQYNPKRNILASINFLMI